MTHPMLTPRGMLKRQAMHAAGGAALGAGLSYLPRVFTWTTIGSLAVKEIVFDPHPSSGFWVKSAVDLAVWSGAILGAGKAARWIGSRLKTGGGAR